MKANALERIYISPNTEESSYYVSNQYSRLIEYTRTDAFMEKACDTFCSVCNMPNCNGSKECSFVIKFRESLMQKL